MSGRRVLWFVSSAVVWLTGSSAWAYSKGNHKTLTHEAVLLAKACGAIDASYHEDALVDFNRDQDDVLRKARLWHFPWSSSKSDCNPCKSSCYTKAACPLMGWICEMPVFRSFDPWVNFLLVRSDECLSETDLPRAIGALLHYLQDLAVPAHAVPVFHPTWLFGHDEFDSYGFEVAHESLLERQDAAEICRTLRAPAPERGGADDLLRKMRDDTRESLNKPVRVHIEGQPATVQWRMFWRESGEGGPSEFGRYGCGNDQFGDASFECDGKQYAVDESEYARFADARAAAAIIASARLIALMHKQHLPSTRASCATSPDEEVWLPSKDGLERIRDDQSSLCAPMGERGAPSTEGSHARHRP